MTAPVQPRERPILFSGEMVRAILEGRKTQTRRVMNPQPPGWCREFGFTAFTPDGSISGRGEYGDQGPAEKFFRIRYGIAGDRLWVREAWTEKAWSDSDCARMGFQNAPRHPSEDYLGTRLRAVYRAGCSTAYGDVGPWRPSIFMPRWASRMALEITDVRVQRIGEITEEDAQAEGVVEDGSLCYMNDARSHQHLDARNRFACLWDSINAKRGYGWDTNPWVWAISFRRLAAHRLAEHGEGE